MCYIWLENRVKKIIIIVIFIWDIGNKIVVDYLISKGYNDFNGGLDGSITNNHLNLAEYFIKLGANINRPEIKLGIYS